MQEAGHECKAGSYKHLVLLQRSRCYSMGWMILQGMRFLCYGCW
jgi:hypothetical protein